MNTSTNFLLVVVIILVCSTAHAQLSDTFYATTCPTLPVIVQTAMTAAVAAQPRVGAFVLRIHFHDCFVNGCDGSVLLDDTAAFQGEKSSIPNQSLIRGFELIDTIKALVEITCPGRVSCADILALAARDGVFLLRGPTWTVQLGRRDARTASLAAANSNLPSPFADLATLTTLFSSKGLDARDLTALSGAHTIGQAQCQTFRDRIYNDANIEPGFAALRRTTCPATGGNANLAPLDVGTPDLFDNRYFQNLVISQGLLRSDQVLFNNGTQDDLVRSYSTSNSLFSSDFAAAMIRMGGLDPLTGLNGEIRTNCRRLN